MLLSKKKDPYNKTFYSITTKYLYNFKMFWNVCQTTMASQRLQVRSYKFTGYDNFGRPFTTFPDFYRIYNMLLTVEYT